MAIFNSYVSLPEGKMNSADVDRCEPEVQPARHNMAQSSPKICVLFRTTKKSWIFGCVKLCQISLILQSNRDILCVFLAYQSFCAITWLEKGQKNQNKRYHQAVFRRRMHKNQKPSSSIIPFSKNSILSNGLVFLGKS